MKDQFVTYEIAKRLKGLGFDGACMAVFEENKTIARVNDGTNAITAWQNSDAPTQHWIAAPLWQQAIDWLREKGFNVSIIENPYTQGPGPGMYEWSIKPRMPKNQSLPQPRGYGSGCGQQYEQAREAAILKALQLINN